MFTILFIVSIISAKENACILILCRNQDLGGIVNSLKSFEDTFNRKYKYPYVFLNDAEFTEDFKKKINEVTENTVEFGHLTKDQWGNPDHIDLKKAEKGMEELAKKGIIYAKSLTYRHMCRFFSGKFFKHELTLKYDYYWRVEPDVTFFCEMNYDPFEFMKKNKKKYGFVITISEFMETIPTLWESVIEFININQDKLKNKEILGTILDQNKKYNGCHYWSNFEIASFDIFRNELYENYFNYLDKKGGFYYERWGDAPVHTIAVNLFLDKKEIHFFEDVGYHHAGYLYCPTSPSRIPFCKCDPSKNGATKNQCLKDFIKETL